MSFTVVIPARYHSSRLPGKPLLDLGGQSMLQRVYGQACKSQAQRVVIATDNTQIQRHAKTFCDQVLMTRIDHPSGTDRLQEAVSLLALEDDHMVVNVQGDEPLIPPTLIDQVAYNLKHYSQAAIATLAEAIVDPSQVFNPHVVKVVCNRAGFALYFSRAPVPWRQGWLNCQQQAVVEDILSLDQTIYLRHVGLYAYRVDFLHRFVSWPQVPIETHESLEQLRALYEGELIHVDIAIDKMMPGVDTPNDLEKIRAFLKQTSN
jgi:3-deoxy-manno-octulosonate cytidylyltransferase (CMP-KDO synthetase)